MKGLPPDVTYSIAYDRSALIDRAVKTLEEKLLEESIVVALVCLAFLLHLRSALVAIIILPIAVLIVVPRHVRPGHQLEHHVAGRHRHRHRRDGGRGHHHDRERAQAPGARPAAGSRTGTSSATPRSRSARRCSIRCWSSRSPSSRSSRCRRRKAGCSSRWPSPRPIPWPRRRCSPSRWRRF